MWRSRAAGLALACLIGACGDAGAPSVAAQSPQAAQAQQVPVGRYTIIHSPHIQRDTVLLDTATGRTWGLVEDTERDHAVFWTVMGRDDNADEMAAWADRHPRAGEKR